MRTLENKTIGIFGNINAPICQDTSLDNYERYLRGIVYLSEIFLYEGANLAFINQWGTEDIMNNVCCSAVKSKKSMGDPTVIHYTKPMFKYEPDFRLSEYRIMKSIVSNEPLTAFTKDIDFAIFLTGYEDELKTIKKPTFVSNIFQKYPVVKKLQKNSGLTEAEWTSLTDQWLSVNQFASLVLKGTYKLNDTKK